jgi:hypothetical protein
MLRQRRATRIVVLVTAGALLALNTRLEGRRPANGVQQPRAQAASSRERNAAVPDRTLLDRYCVSCHSERLKTGGLVLENLDLAQTGSHAEMLEKVLMKIRAGQMPPAGRPQPSAAESAAFTSTLETLLERASEAAPNPGRPTVHRLNRTEYKNSIRDLLALDVDVTALLPADDTDAHGFDNNADVLTVSPALAARYLSAARKVSRLAVGQAIAATIETYQLPRLLMQDDRIGDRLPFGSSGGTAIEHYFPADGEYLVKIGLQKNNYDYAKGLADEHKMEVRIDRQLVKTFTIGGMKAGAPPASYAGTLYGSPEWEKYALQADDGLEVRVRVKAGRRVVGVSFGRTWWEPEDVGQPRQGGWPQSNDEMFDASPGVDRIVVAGPYDAHGPSETPGRLRIFSCRPRSASGDTACARTILSTLVRRAYRRPATDADLRPLLDLFAMGNSGEGGFDAGIQLALERILVSPDFLFRIEQDAAGTKPGAVNRLNDYELATRLSFFLWSSIPDDALLDAAEHKTLRDPKGLERQVRRMLADPRSQALIDNFAGQWLVLRNIRDVQPDADLFPEFDENLRDAFRQETTLFLQSQLRDDRSVIDLLTADYTFVNERLARHYQIPNVYGSRFRKVTVPENRRGGILGQGSLLTVTSYANRTSPVLRGKWLLETILGTPPPPPPPDVPALQDRGEGGKVATVRERLERHRSNPACSGCHSAMDPLGFALENFDATGHWRTSDAGTPVDSSGALPGGAKFEGLAGLVRLLVERRDQFAANVDQRLLGYALGRQIEFYDLPTVRRVAREAAADNYRWSALILGIVKSTPFQTRRAVS